MKFIFEEEPRTFIYARKTPVVAKLCGAVQNVLWPQLAEVSQSCIWYQASPGVSVILVDTDSLVLLTDRTGSYAIVTGSMVPIERRVFLLSEDLTAPDCVSSKEAMYFGTQKQIASGLEFISVLFQIDDSSSANEVWTKSFDNSWSNCSYHFDSRGRGTSSRVWTWLN